MENHLDQYGTSESISPSKFEDYFESLQTNHDMQKQIDIDQNFDDECIYQEKSKKKKKKAAFYWMQLHENQVLKALL